MTIWRSACPSEILGAPWTLARPWALARTWAQKPRGWRGWYRSCCRRPGRVGGRARREPRSARLRATAARSSGASKLGPPVWTVTPFHHLAPQGGLLLIRGSEAVHCHSRSAPVGAPPTHPSRHMTHEAGLRDFSIYYTLAQLFGRTAYLLHCHPWEAKLPGAAPNCGRTNVFTQLLAARARDLLGYSVCARCQSVRLKVVWDGCQITRAASSKGRRVPPR